LMLSSSIAARKTRLPPALHSARMSTAPARRETIARGGSPKTRLTVPPWRTRSILALWASRAPTGDTSPAMHDAPIRRITQASDTKVRRRDPEALTRYAQRGNPYLRERGEKGKVKASLDALETWKRVRTLCGRCGSIVFLHVAAREARADGRDVLVETDGCAGSVACKPPCSPYFQRGRAESRQRKAAQSLLAGDFVLIRRPRSCSDDEVSVVSDAERMHVARTTLEILDM